MFVDASAIVAILTAEPERSALLDALDKAEAPITSVLAIFEAVVAVSRKKTQSVVASETQVQEFLATSQITTVPIGDKEGSQSLKAFLRYGKGQGHPAQLNMGDCFAYACARTHDVPLLFVGNDFARTDIRSATA